MYDIAKKAREGMKGKAQRLASQKYERVDSSDWTPPAPINAEVKTGLRPVSKQALKSGGAAGKKRADRVARKAGGRIGIEMVNRNVKEANQERSGIKHDGGLKKGGRAKKADGGDAIGDLIRRTPAPAKKPEFQMPDKVPLPPRRQPDRVPPRDYKKADPRLLAAAKGGKIKHSDVAEDKALIKSMVKGKALKDKACSGGRMKKADGGPTKKSAWNMSASEMLESARKRDEDTARRVEESKKKYPGMSAIERAEQAIKDKFSPEYFAKMKAAKKKELDEDQGYQEFAERRSKKADGGAPQVDARLGIVKPKAMEFGQNLVTPGLKKGGRIKKQIGGGIGIVPPQMPTMPQQAMSNAQGRPFQGGQFAPPGLANMPSQMPAAGPSVGAPSMPMLPTQAAPQAGAALGAARPFARATGGRIARAEGGKTSKAKGKTNINITINTKAPAGDMGVNQPDMPKMPPMPAGAPMPAGPAMPPMPPSAPMMGAPRGGPAGPQMPAMPRPGGFKRGGKVYRSYKDMDAGAGSGLGRLEKTEIASRSAKKAGGKVYRSYKDMDAGSGSGLGRLEKTEIQKRKK